MVNRLISQDGRTFRKEFTKNPFVRSQKNLTGTGDGKLEGSTKEE